jgi:hypothetical protein
MALNYSVILFLKSIFVPTANDAEPNYVNCARCTKMRVPVGEACFNCGYIN